MRRLLFLHLLILLLAAFINSCGGVDSSASDSGNQDGDEQSDGDAVLSDGDMNAEICNSNDDCSDGSICDPVNGICVQPECRENGQCVEKYSDESYCSEGGICVNGTCFGFSDCPNGTYCSIGYCRPLPGCDKIADARILVSLPFIRAGHEVELRAAAYDEQGVVIPPLKGMKFEWESMNSEVISVNSESATAVGGQVSGTTTLMMHLRYADPSCVPYEISDTISMQNFAAYDEGSRVVVIDSSSNQPVGGAVVNLNGVSAITSSDADKGVVLFKGAEAPFTVHVFHENYHYFSIIGISEKDVLIPLDPFAGPNRSAGVKGALDFSEIGELSESAYGFGIVGTSFPGSLLSDPVDMLFSSPVFKGIPQDILNTPEALLPSNIELFGLHSDGAASSYLAEGRNRTSAAWAWAAYLPADEMKEMLALSLSEGLDNWSALFFSTLSFTEHFRHGMIADFELQSSSMVPDNGSFNNPPYNRSDLNGNGDHQDLVPDYSSYLDLGNSLKPNRPMNRQVSVEPGKLPTFGRDHLDGTLVLLGSSLPGGDFLPLGVGIGDRSTTRAKEDDKDEGADSARITVRFSPYYGGLNGEYTLISYAIRADDAQESISNGPLHSAVIHRFSGKTGSVVLPDYLDVVPYAFFDETSRKVTVYAGEGADFYRVRFSAGGRNWDVLADTASLKELDIIEFVLPKPISDDPCSSGMSVYAVDLAQDYSLDVLAAFDDRTLSGLDLVTDRISVYKYAKKKK